MIEMDSMSKYIPIILFLVLIGIFFSASYTSAQPQGKYAISPTTPAILPKEVNITLTSQFVLIDNVTIQTPSPQTIPLQLPTPMASTPINHEIKINRTYMDKVPYDTHCNQQKLSELKGKKMALIFLYNNSQIMASEDLGPSTSHIVLDYQKNKFLSEFDSLFKIEDVSDNSQVLKECSSIREILQKIDADGGILVTNDYGYKMSSNLLQGIWEKILPWFKDFIRVMFGSNVEYYDFASNTYIVDKEGKVVWNFYGKISASPERKLTIGEIAEGVAGGDPSEKKVIKAMIPITNHYTEYMRWLVEADLNGTLNKSYYDYPKRGGRISIFPASADSYLPLISDAPQCQYKYINEPEIPGGDLGTGLFCFILGWVFLSVGLSPYTLHRQFGIPIPDDWPLFSPHLPLIIVGIIMIIGGSILMIGAITSIILILALVLITIWYVKEIKRQSELMVKIRKLRFYKK